MPPLTGYLTPREGLLHFEGIEELRKVMCAVQEQINGRGVAEVQIGEMRLRVEVHDGVQVAGVVEHDAACKL